MKILARETTNSETIREANFRQARRFHREGILSLKDYFTNIVELHQFVPKNKYIETLEKQIESDATTISDRSDEEGEVNELSGQLKNSTLESHESHNTPPAPAYEPETQQTQSESQPVTRSESLSELEDNAVCNLCLKTFKKGVSHDTKMRV